MIPGWVLFDWGDTLMVDLGEPGPMASWPRVEAVPHAREALEALKSQHWHVALATNAAESGEAEVRKALGRVGLDEFVDRVFSSRDVGYKKPTPEFFAFLSAELGVGPDNLVMVGDNAEIDVLGANAAGIRAVWLCTGDRELPPDPMRATIHDLAELPGLLALWRTEGEPAG